jgi:cysteine rich repeat protein
MEMSARWTTVAAILSLAFVSLPASTPPANAQALAYCKADAERLCSGVPPGGGKLVRCLKGHENEVSIGCAKELKKVKAEMGK